MDKKKKKPTPKDAPSDVQEKLHSLGKSELDPYEINFLPEFEQDRGPREPFINEFGVLIGDHEYTSPHSPLEQWSKDTDPAIMAGDQWVHGYKDIGFHTKENRDYFEKGIPPSPTGEPFMHPYLDVAYEKNVDDEPVEEKHKNKDHLDPNP